MVSFFSWSAIMAYSHNRLVFQNFWVQKQYVESLLMLHCFFLPLYFIFNLFFSILEKKGNLLITV